MIAVVLWAAAAAAPAKAPSTTEAPEADWSVPWMAVGYSLATLAGIAVIGFKNSKRTHLD